MKTFRKSGLVAAATVLGLFTLVAGCSSGSSTNSPTTDASAGKCTPNAMECLSSTVAAVCPQNGSEWLSAPCPTGETCSAGVCKAPDGGAGCTPNAKSCLSTTMAGVCQSNGTGWVPVACATGQTCSNGVCAGVDAGPACKPNAAECVSTTVARVCPSDGSGWLAVECASGQTCSNGVCAYGDGGASLCTPNAKQCASSSAAEICSPSGSSWLIVGCATGQSCVNGSCTYPNDSGTLCTPNATQCATSTITEVCSTDGSQWVLTTDCAEMGEICKAGACTFSADQPCAPGETMCASSTTAAACKTDGSGWTTTTCPTNTSCSFNGYAGTYGCMGALPVGPLECVPGTGTDTTVSTGILVSKDGYTETTVPCPSGQYCIPNSPPVCLAGTCTPDPGGCDTVCGDKVDSTQNQTLYMSQCAMTANGWTWIAEACPAPGTCDPQGGGACGTAGLYTPSCTQVCTPGATRCAPDGSGVQTCSAMDGGSGWGAAVACDATMGMVCGTDTAGNGVCGDAVCFFGTGTCTSTGSFRACNNFVLGPTSGATPCPAGQSCEATGTTSPGAYQPGACTSTCTPGTSECQDGTVMTCTADGVWGDATPCTSPDTCQQYTTSTGASAAVCGVCMPGTHTCATADGVVDGGIELCGTNGQLGGVEACQVGICQFNSVSNDNACLAQCVPGTTVCNSAGQIGTANCSSTGTLPTFKDCATGTSCRVDSNGNGIGCIQCLGPDHGLPPDTACTGATIGSTGTTDIDTCGPSDTWLTPVACTGGTSCYLANSMSCETVYDPYTGQYFPGTNSNLEKYAGLTCVGIDEGNPEVCGSYSDCCTDWCAPIGPATIPTCGTPSYYYDAGGL